MSEDERATDGWFCAYGHPRADIIIGAWGGWMRFSPRATDEEARDLFVEFYGRLPAELRRTALEVLVGPLRPEERRPGGEDGEG